MKDNIDDMIKKMGLEGQVREHGLPRPVGNRDLMSSSIIAHVDNKPQLLRSLTPKGISLAMNRIAVDSSLTEPGREVLYALFSCFQKQGSIQEGVVKDVIFGFVDVGKMDPVKVAHGLVDLRRMGYVEFVAPDNTIVDEHCSNLKECWLRYTKKLMGLVHEKGEVWKEESTFCT